MKSLYIIDGHALIFRMYYAFLRRPMVNSKGMDTSILFGFSKYLFELIEKRHPTHLAVCFDPPGGTFRNRMYPEYKANRGETPELVVAALEPLIGIVEALGLPVFMIPDYEADDVAGTLAKMANKAGFEEVYMVTPDKDYGQLIAPGIFQLKPGKAGEDDVVMDCRAVCEKYGICDPAKVIDMLAICGDTADNVPGVKGVGEVGAAKLIAKYGSLEAIYEHIEELTASQKAKFEEARDHIALSKELVTICTTVPLEPDWDAMKVDTAYTPAILDLFKLYEFPSLKRYLRGVDAASAPSAKADAASVQPQSLPSEDRLAFLVHGGAVCLARVSGGEVLIEDMPFSSAKTALEDPATVKVGFDIKKSMHDLADAGICLQGRLEDIELMHYLINPERSHQLEMLAQSYLGMDLSKQNEEQGGGSLFSDDSFEEQDYSAHVRAMLMLSGVLSSQMQSQGLAELYDRIEEPLVRVLAGMEMAGVKIDMVPLREFASSLREEIAHNEALCREISGEPGLNVGSPKQVGEVIFEKMKLDPKAKKPAGKNWSTDEETLLALADKSPIIDAILDYRAAKKLLSTYIEPFPGYISEKDGRVHTTFNQALTSTGRLSSSNPNLQNIPIRTEKGKAIREAFVSEDSGSVIMSADYSQIELRIMAHLCQDEHLVGAFKAGVDVHRATAQKIFGVGLDEVTPDMRRVAKTANFGIMYGISAFGLSQRLHCSRSEAKKIIEDYFTSFPSIRTFIDRTIEDCKSNGYVQTLFGRRRYLPDINSANAVVRGVAERNAVNAPIQGTSADIIKLAMIAVDRQIRERGLESRLILQIHDELMFEVPSSEIDIMKEIVKREMEGVLELSVPLTVECSYGKNWLEAH